ncbi:MAG: putative beta-lysine N-acetyltransferase [Candidatus Eremiobacteraeota bacterium]|nr:putative beta-lysine N-acetyltransferase [Candidatus Eremiobacteraeota bacterium]
MMQTSAIENMGKKVEISEEGYSLSAFISPFNMRVRLIKYNGPRIDKVVKKLDELAYKNDFAKKIFAKVRESDSSVFGSMGYENEGVIKGYYNGKDAVVMSRFVDVVRRSTQPSVVEKELQVERILKGVEESSHEPELPKGYVFLIAETENQFKKLAELYREVFESYPFPIYNPEYLMETAKSHIIYGLIFNENGKLVAASSAEIDFNNKNAEMTDFATLTSERGKGLASVLLTNLEKAIEKKDIKCLYTLARSKSVGMNVVFKKAGYEFTGKAKNNCNICGEFENMSIWCK